MIITEKKEVVGQLLTQSQVFEMLDINPTRARSLSFLLRESCFEFYVVVEGFAQYIIVSRGSFVIIPYLEPVEWQVKFLVEGEEPTPVDMSKLEARIGLAAFYPPN